MYRLSPLVGLLLNCVCLGKSKGHGVGWLLCLADACGHHETNSRDELLHEYGIYCENTVIVPFVIQQTSHVGQSTKNILYF
jgi:hypothetical protein